MKQQNTIKKLARAAGLGIVTISSLIASTTTAHADTEGIRGATTWIAPCRFFTSQNRRTATGDTISVQLTSVETLGVKFRVRFPKTGAVSDEAYFSDGSDEYKVLTNVAGGKKFRNQFSCINGRDQFDRPLTDFEGSQQY
jgi:hypothetical protein